MILLKFFNGHKQLIQAVGFWVLLVFLVGFCSGLAVSREIWNYKAKEVVKVGGVLIEGHVYDIKQRP